MSDWHAALLQLQARVTDWMAGALDTAYFSGCVATVATALAHMETAASSLGGWLLMWDPGSRNYFYQVRPADFFKPRPA